MSELLHPHLLLLPAPRHFQAEAEGREEVSEDDEWWGAETEAALAPDLARQVLDPAPTARALQRGSRSLGGDSGWTAAQTGTELKSLGRGPSLGITSLVHISRKQ